MSESNEAMKKLIKLINTLQNVITNSGLSLSDFCLPQIAVVGGQSTGKSSVLENFVGRDFLPRGPGIVTRCPLIVQLIQDSNEYAVFGHLQGKKLTDFNEVRAEIEKRTSELIGKGKAVTATAINLTIYSPNVVNLTLIDLPGLTKVAVGDQPDDIGEQIRSMVLQFIESKNTLILAISAANTDIANSDGLQLAKEVDKEGERTFGVLTKLDTMDEGTDARDILLNKVYHLKRGFVGLVNRNTQDIKAKKNIKEAQKKEMEFIRNHKAYRDLEDRMGTKYLQNHLSKALSEHILESLPELKLKLKQQRDEIKERLEEFGDFDGSDEMARAKINDLIHLFSMKIKMDIDGYCDNDVSSNDFSAGAKLIHCYSQDFNEILQEAEANISLQEMITILANLQGFRYSTFIPDRIFDVCIKKRTECYKKPSDLCLLKVEEILQETSCKVFNQIHQFQSYPKLKEAINKAYANKMSEYAKQTKADIHRFVDCQGSFFNQKHPDFQLIASSEDIPENYMDEVDGMKANVISEPLPKSVELMRDDVKIKMDGCADKDYSLLLTNYYLAFYELTKMFLGNIKCEYLEVTDTGKVNELQLTSRERNLPLNAKRILFVCKDRHQKKRWIESFQKTEAEITVKESTSQDETDRSLPSTNQVQTKFGSPSNDSTKFGSPSKDSTKFGSPSDDYSQEIMDKQKEDTSNREKLWITAYNVNSYMSIIHTILADCIPKFIKHLMVDQMINYVCTRLLNDITSTQNNSKPAKLLEISEEEESRRTEIQRIYEATENALETINSFPIEFKFQ